MAEGGSGRLVCSICLESFTKPKLLPCYHTFCTECLHNFVQLNSKNGKFSCPLCRKCIDVPSNGVAGFQTNFYIETDELEAKQVVIHCDVCGPESIAEHKCLDCEENFCFSCTKAHASMKMTRHHNLVQIQTDDPSLRGKLKYRSFCKTHPRDEIRLVCKQCDELLCVVCMLTEHHGHKSREVTEEAADVKADLGRVIMDKKTMDHEKKILSGISKLEREDIRLVDGLQFDQNQLQKHAEKLHAVVDTLVGERKTELTNEYKKNIDENKQKLFRLQTAHKSWTSLLAISEQILKKESDIGMVKQGRHLRHRITELRDGDTSIGLKRQYLCKKLFRQGYMNKRLISDIIGKVENPTVDSAIPLQFAGMSLRVPKSSIGELVTGLDAFNVAVHDTSSLQENMIYQVITAEGKNKMVEWKRADHMVVCKGGQFFKYVEMTSPDDGERQRKGKHDETLTESKAEEFEGFHEFDYDGYKSDEDPDYVMEEEEDSSEDGDTEGEECAEGNIEEEECREEDTEGSVEDSESDTEGEESEEGDMEDDFEDGEEDDMESDMEDEEEQDCNTESGKKGHI